MNLTLADAAIAAYSDSISQKDTDRLAFFREIWVLQSDIAATCDSSWVAPVTQRVVELAEGHVPLLRESPVVIDPARFTEALQRMLSLLRSNGIVDDEAQGWFDKASLSEVCELSDLRLAGANPSAYLDSLKQTIEEKGACADTARLGSLAASLALKPFLEQPAQAAAKRLKEASCDERHPLTCPVCGSAPSVGKVGGSTAKGRHRSLWCPQCGCEWAFERVRCARCGTTNQGHLHYHSLEGDDAHRIASCDECGGYLRVVFVDEEKTLVPFSFEVEDVLMARLDAIAADPSLAEGGN